jgi:hypothetical protein
MTSPPPNDVGATVGTNVPWDIESDVLSLKSFPSTSILRWGRKGEHLCSCTDQQRHRSLFTVNLQWVAPQMEGKLRKGEIPHIPVCFNADNIWECRLPREITGLQKRVEFESLPNVACALRTLKRGTYWYPQLLKKKKLKESAFGRQMARLLAGMPSPEGKEPLGAIKRAKVSSAAVQRLRSCLATVDGLLMQAVLAFPGSTDVQDWKRIDQIQRSLIANILPDYFRDLDVDRLSTYEKLKSFRGEVKAAVFNPIGTTKSVRPPRELSVLRVLCSMIRGKTPLSTYQGMILSQTRASGVPPRSLYIKTLAKTKAILTTPSSKELYARIAKPLAQAVDHVYSDLLVRLGGPEKRESFFETLMREAKISLSDSGEFFTPTAQGGKLEAARIVLQQNPEVAEVNLHTGALTGKLLTKENAQMGDRLFHWALGCFRDRSRCYDRNNMSCRISLVAELGKYRTITVSSLQHALLLHPLSHVGLKILEVFPSSESGVGAANHAWNFFKRLSHGNPSADFIFREDVNTVVYSTDWESSTDYCDPYIAGAMLNRLCSKLGVPKWYRETCVFALTAPRQVETLDRNQVPIEVFYTSRGVLMGDPLTKTVLHLHHLVGRRICLELMFLIFKDKILDDESSSEEE